VRIVGNASASGIYHATDDSAERVSDVVGAIAAFASPRPDIRHGARDRRGGTLERGQRRAGARDRG